MYICKRAIKRARAHTYAHTHSHSSVHARTHAYTQIGVHEIRHANIIIFKHGPKKRFDLFYYIKYIKLEEFLFINTNLSPHILMQVMVCFVITNNMMIASKSCV